MLNIQTLTDRAQTQAQSLKIPQYDIYGSSVEEAGVEVSFGETKQVQASNRSSVIVRVWNEKGMIGVTSTTDLDDQGIKLALQTALEASYFGITENVPVFSSEAKTAIADVGNQTAAAAPINILIEQLITAEKQLLEAHPAITGVPYNGLSEETTERFYLNSEGAERHEARSYASIYLYSRTEQEGKKPRSAGEMKISRSLADLDIAGCLQTVTEKTISSLNYQT
ncbi:MAG: PmbA/TldA family metallopeptidase, partial [Microcystaceae cyanobacterium]